MFFLISTAELSCSDTLCENGGTCTEVDGPPGYKCICSGGYAGQNCETFGKSSLSTVTFQ